MNKEDRLLAEGITESTKPEVKDQVSELYHLWCEGRITAASLANKAYLAGYLKRHMEGIAHPPEGETPSEAAPGADDRMRERFLAAVWTEFDYRHACMTGDCSHQNGAECDAELARVAKVMVTEYLSGEDAPGTPIEKAAREALQYARSEADSLMQLCEEIIELDKPSVKRWMKLVRDKIDGALSSLPQEGQAEESAADILRDLLTWMEGQPAEKRDDVAIARVREIRRSLGAREGAAGEGEPLASVGGPAGQKKGEERP